MSIFHKRRIGTPLVNGRSSTLNNGIVSFWKLEEASGTRIDAVGSNDLADNNTVTQGVGKVGNAASFLDDNNEYLSIADNASLSLTTSITLACWLYIHSTVAGRNLITKFNATGNQKSFLLDVASNQLRWIISADGLSTSANISATSFGNLSINTWYFVCARYDGTNVYISVNAGTVDSAAYSSDIFDSTAAFIIGQRDSGGTSWRGLIDAAGLWNRSLSVAEITELYNMGAGRENPF